MSRIPHILFVDDDVKAGELMLRFSDAAPYRVTTFRSSRKALAAFREHGADLIVSDLRMPEMNGMKLLQAVRSTDADVPFIIITGFANVDDAIEALRLGASDFIKKPFDMDELQVLIEKTLGHTALLEENRHLKQQLSNRLNKNMVGNSPAIEAVYRTISKIADIRCNVIIEGESGTGKELAAHAIHDQSKYASAPFQVIDCGALTETLLESELFGHVKGAFTGAYQNKKGLLQTASGGTVFLDEIGNISDAMQIKLLRVIQEQQVTPVGGTRAIDIDVRFIVATNRNLDELVLAGTFREDLYHRLNVVKITVPPLRERREDIPLLIHHYVKHFAQHYRRDVTGFDADAMQKLQQYDWPGNVRELHNLVERQIALADGPVMPLSEIPSLRSKDNIDKDLPTLAELEKRYIMKLLDHFDQSREKTAETLGINKSTLWRKLQSYKNQDHNQE